MDALRQYNIDIFNLSNSTHNYTFEVNNTFFNHFENSLVGRGVAEVNVSLTKSATFIEMQFQIKGEIELVCDRSLEKYTEKVENTNSLLFKYGDSWEELSDEIMVIPKDEQRLNMGQYIYEFICLDIPMKKIHPKFRDQENEGVVYSSKEKDSTEKKSDPRWDKLKGLIK